MKLITTLLIQLVFLLSIHSQNVITEYNLEDAFNWKKEYKYDAKNRVIEEVYSNHRKTEWVYENDLLVLKRIFLSGVGGWRLSSAIENIYDGDGCLLNQERKNFLPSFGTVSRNISMINEFDCTEPWKNEELYSSLTNSFTTIEARLTRTRTDSSEIEIYEEYSRGDEEWIEKGMLERKYNHKGKVTEHRVTPVSFYSFAELYIYTYDETGEILLKSELYQKPADTDYYRFFAYDEYFYEDFVLQKIIKHKRSGQYAKTFYEYYCDGLLKEVRTEFNNDDRNPQVVKYEYDQKVEDCEEIENFDLNIYPNPVNGVFYIESDIFQKENSEILIYNTIGKLMYRQQVKDRLQRVEVRVNEDMSSNNMLIVHLIAEGGDKLNKKIFIGKLHR